MLFENSIVLSVRRTPHEIKQCHKSVPYGLILDNSCDEHGREICDCYLISMNGNLGREPKLLITDKVRITVSSRLIFSVREKYF